MKPLFKPAPTEVFAGGVQLPSPWAHAAHKPVFIAFLVCFAIAWTALLLGGFPSEDWPWLNGLFWLLAAATSLTGLARRLPEQNVFVAATLIVAVSFGIAIIVYGHVAGSTINSLTPPIQPKQLGVASFLFVLGYTLAREVRPALEVVLPGYHETLRPTFAVPDDPKATPPTWLL